MLVVIPHHSRPDLLPRALAAVAGHPVLIVDDSPHGQPLPPGVPSLRTSGEEGFARAVNRGLAWAEEQGHALVLVLNDDAAPEPECLTRLLPVMDDDSVALVGPLLLRGEQVESAGLRYHRRSARLHQDTRPPAGLAEVDALSGACLLMRSHLRFDGHFPHGMEDVELSLRVRAAGQRVLLQPTARCQHLGGASLDRRSPRATAAALQGHLRLAGPSRLRRGLVLGYALGQVLKEGPPDRLLGLWEGWSAARR